MRSIAVVLSLLTIYSSLCGQSFREIAVNSEDTYLNSVEMVTATVGYAAGEKGIYKTLDGGETWSLQPDFVNPVQWSEYDLFNTIHLHFFDEFEGIAYGWHALNNEMILQTTDGGEHWTIRHFVFPGTNTHRWNTLNNAAFDGNTGFIAGNNGRFLKTDDRGVTWSASGLLDKPDLTTVQVPGGNRIVTGGDYRFLISEDGGVTWSKVVTDFDCSDFHFFDALAGIATSSDGRFFKTTDGGRTWKQDYFSSSSAITSIEFDGQIGYAIGYRKLYKSTNGGDSWLQVYSGQDEITSIDIVSPLKAMFTLRNGNLLVTSNGAAVEAKQPVISGLSISSGVISQSFTISGSDFEHVTEVRVNGVRAPLRLTDGVIYSQIPSNSTSGKIELVWPGGSVFSAGSIDISTAPLLYPQSISNNTTVRLSGENLLTVNEFYIDDQSYPFVIVDNNALEFDLPGNYFRTELAVLVRSPHGSYTRNYDVLRTPSVSSFSVEGSFAAYSGSEGKKVTVNGIDFRHATGVKIGAVPVADFEVLSDHTMTFVIPATDTLMTAPIRITSPSGTGSSATDLIVYPRPVLNHLSPLRIKAGDEVKLEGKYLTTPTGFFNIITVNDASSYRVRYRAVDDHTVYFTVPHQLQLGGELKIQFTNAGGATSIASFGLLVNGVRDYVVSEDIPLVVESGTALFVNGFFPYYLDSVLVDGKKVEFSVVDETRVYFYVTGNPGLHHFSFYDEGRVIVEEHPFTIGTPTRPRVGDLSPLVVSPGSLVKLNMVFRPDLLSVKVGDLKARFWQDGEFVYLIVPDCAVSGHVTVNTLAGFAFTEQSLTVVPTGKAAPQIFSIGEPISDATGEVFGVSGNNFSALTEVRFDQHSVDFRYISDDSLVVYFPKVAIVSSTSSVVVESPFGTASHRVDYSVRNRREIVSVSKLSARRGEVLEVKISPKNPIVYYEDINRFFFGSTPTFEFYKVDEETYLVNVPLNGDVNGLIGISQFGLTQYSAFTFVLDEPAGYCEARGREKWQSLISLSIAGKKFVTSDDPYIDKTGEPVMVAPGQPLRLDVQTEQASSAVIYADWNNDGNFADDEAIFYKINVFPTGDSAVHAVVTVPEDLSANTSIRLRVVTKVYGNREDMRPCGFVPAGQVIDFALAVASPVDAFRIFDFFPSVGTTNTIVTITGTGLAGLSQVKIGGVDVTVNALSDTHAEFIVTDEPESGAVTFMSDQGDVVNSRGFLVDRTILPPDDQHVNYKYVYRATVAGADIPFVITHWYDDEYLITPLMAVDRRNGELCYHLPGGLYCSPEPVMYEPTLSGEPVLNLSPGQEVTLLGYNLFSIVSLSINGVAVSFENPNDNSIILTVPENASSGKLMVVTVNGSASLDAVIAANECQTVSDVWREGVEIVNVTAGAFTATSGKNTTSGLSDYTSLIIDGESLSRTEVSITLKNFSAAESRVAVEPFLRFASGETETRLEDFALTTNPIPVDGEQTVRGWIAFPENVSPATHILLLKVIYVDQPGNCENLFGEKELYSFRLTSETGNCALPYITTLTPQSGFVGDEIDIYGANLAAATTVLVGEIPAAFDIISDSHLRMTIPDDARTAKVFVTTPVGSAESPAHLVVRGAQTILAIDPVFGKTGDQINLIGQSLSGTKIVHFGATQTSTFTIVDDTRILVTVPPLAVTDFVTITGPDDVRTEEQKVFFICDGLTYNQYCRIDQTITFAELPSVNFLEGQMVLEATASSGLPVEYVSSDWSIASISGNVVIFHKAGQVTITATQPGDYRYNPALEVSRQLTIGKAEQIITYDIPDMQMSDLPIELLVYGEASSGLDLSFDLEGNVSFEGILIWDGSPGPVKVTVSQDGNESYFPATPVVAEFCILPPKPEIIAFADEGKLSVNTSFQVNWYRNGTLIQDENGADILITEGGSYTAEVNASGCLSDLSNAVQATITGVDSGAESLSVHPNPFLDVITITNPAPIRSYRLLSPTGTVVRHGLVGNDDDGGYRIELDNLTSGAYFLEVTGASGIIGRSMIIRE